MKTIKMLNAGRPCTVYEYKGWYVPRGGTMVNRTNPDCLQSGVDINDCTKVEDYDCFTWEKPITSMNQLIKTVNS